MLKHAIFFSTALFMAGTALAAPGDRITLSSPETIGRLHDAWEDLHQAEANLLSTAQFDGLNMLAFQAVVAWACDGRRLNHARLGLDMDRLLAESDPTLPADLDEQKKAALLMEKKAAVLAAFGARYGLFLAEANQDKATFCHVAARLTSPGQDGPALKGRPY